MRTETKLPFDFTYLSLGAGVQSTALYLASTRGVIGVPRAQVAIFADTGDEPEFVYQHLEELETWAWIHEGIPIERVTAGHLSGDILGVGSQRRFVSIPAFGSRGGMLRRQCTREYKIEPIERHVRQEWLKLRKRQRAKDRVACMLGISIDEVSRMKPSRRPWITNLFPLVQIGWDRNACRKYIKEVGLEVPRKSSCVFCPYHSDSYWRDLKKNFPVEWETACQFDDAIRGKGMRGIVDPMYVHRSRLPLREVDLNEDQADMFDEECEGYCGV